MRDDGSCTMGRMRGIEGSENVWSCECGYNSIMSVTSSNSTSDDGWKLVESLCSVSVEIRLCRRGLQLSTMALHASPLPRSAGDHPPNEPGYPTAETRRLCELHAVHSNAVHSPSLLILIVSHNLIIIPSAMSLVESSANHLVLAWPFSFGISITSSIEHSLLSNPDTTGNK
jgi:hypothetical protein